MINMTEREAENIGSFEILNCFIILFWSRKLNNHEAIRHRFITPKQP